MANTTETVQVLSESRKLGALLVDLIKAAKEIGADGKVSFTEFPAILTLVMKDVIPAVALASAAYAEAQMDAGAELVTAALVGRDIVNALRG